MSTDKRENVTFAERKEEFECQVQTAQTIAISGHMNPDGDCIGSCLGLYTYIVEQYPEKEVTLFLEPVQDKFSFLKYADQITQEKKIDGPYDLFFSLDCSDTDRLHNFKGYFEEAKYKICVDHHFTNEGFGDLRFIVPDASSTCEVLFDMFDWDKISLECAQDLYMGIVHDTGVFKHTNTTRKTMETAGALLEKGIHSEDIIDRTFYKKSYVQNQILGRALMESIILLHGKVIFSIVRKRDFDFYGIDSSDLDGIIDQLRVTDGSSKQKNSFIRFIPISDNVTKLGCLSKTHWKYSGRIRIKGSSMSDFFLMYNAAKLCHYIMGSKTWFFLNIKNSAYHKLIPAFLLVHLTDALPYG